MLLRCVWLAIILFGAVSDVIAKNRTSEKCGIPSSENKYPWLVGIEFKGVDEMTAITYCTGALINRRHVVSNAECFDNYGEPNSVRFGPNITVNGIKCVGESSRNNCKDDGAVRVSIEAVIKHPEFISDTDWSLTSERYHDIALIRLRDIVTYTDVIRPICLPSVDFIRSTTIDRDLYLAGIYYDVPVEYTEKNLGTAMTYLEREEYRKSGNRKMAEDQVGAEYTKEPQLMFACMLTGGLLMNKRDDSYELVGLLEYTSGCMDPKLFTHFFPYMDWIRNVTPDWTPCGRRRVEHVELIVNGEDTKAGDWPWHAAIFRFLKNKNNYICGGTLISKTMVLTAAHCTTISGQPVSPEILSVVLGKYYLIGANIESQEKDVQTVIVHEGFAPKNHLENDIALLKLKTEVIYTDYVQPVCMWYSEVYKRLPSNRVFGTVVGWGIDQSDALSSQLKQSYMPTVSQSTCIQKNPLFYSNTLSNNKKFCAGWANGTSPCNGDSGGGFLVFVPDKANTNSTDAAGSWYVRGIVSLTASLKNHARCDPYQYVVFTDIEKYIRWIQRHLDS